MRMVDLIVKKRNGENLTKDEINFIITEYTHGKIPDYQMSALLMAIYFQGMTKEETSNLTMAMVNSGEVVDLSSIDGKKVDKHSTGGVGDTTTLVLAPLVAAAGVPVAKMSGRGLGHTGGTIDKLESIPGFCTDFTREEFLHTVKNIGAAVVGQNKNLVLADALMYALRDVTGTIESIPLIASSIMSKKIAAGTDAIVLDVKTGKGAFMKTKEQSFELARVMVEIGTSVGRNTIALITNMDEPLGMLIGNSLEVEDAINILTGKTVGELKEVSTTLGAHMLVAAKDGEYTFEKAKAKLNELIENGKAAQKFKEMIKAQHGDEHVVDDTSLLPHAKNHLEVIAEQSGYVQSIEAQSIGHSAMLLGAGRETKDSKLDLSAGIELKKRVGDSVSDGEVIAVLHYNESQNFEEAKNVVLNAYNISKEHKEPEKLIFGFVDKEGIHYL